MELIREFDPWRDPLCTCLDKYGFNPYTGCPHRCQYCYITAYIPNGFNCRPKKDLIKRLKSELKRIDRTKVISMSNSSDPYPPIERELNLTRASLELFKKNDCKILILTKSDIVLRDTDLLKNMKAVVTFTITTLDEKIAEKLEPNAPKPNVRLKAATKLTSEEVPVGIRLDPIIPGVNDNFETSIAKIAETGALHLVSSTYKPRSDNWKRFKNAFPEVAIKLSHYYFEQGERHHNSWYLPRNIRLNLVKKIKESCTQYGLSFATCREGFENLHTAKSCDGSHLVA